jgi:hypothetical protein
MHAVLLHGGPWDGKEVYIRKLHAACIRVNGPRLGMHSVWVMHSYEAQEGRYEFVRTEVVPLSAWNLDLDR